MAAPKFFNISSYSFKPPALPDRDATTVRPDWVLLDTKAYISDLTNGTTATASASNGVPVGVTFWVADLPTLSHFSVNCEAHSDFAEEPRVICSDKNVAILCLYWLSTKSARYRVLYDYFVYTARSPKNAAPSLIRLPNPRPRRVFSPLDMGILPTADGRRGRLCHRRRLSATDVSRPILPPHLPVQGLEMEHQVCATGTTIGGG
jgi:hypothetical protein